MTSCVFHFLDLPNPIEVPARVAGVQMITILFHLQSVILIIFFKVFSPFLPLNLQKLVLKISVNYSLPTPASFFLFFSHSFDSLFLVSISWSI